MKNIFKKLAVVVSCFAVVLFAGVALTACGDKDDSTKVSNATELAEALKKDGTVKLTKDFTVENTTYTISKNVTLDLNGHTLTVKITEGSHDLFNVAGGKLTVNATDGGKVTGTTATSAGLRIFTVGTLRKDATKAQKGELVINGGEFVTDDASVVQVGYGTAIVNGGKFSTSYSDPGMLLNRLNEKHEYYKDTKLFPETFTGYADNVKLVINGGSFKGYNPQDNKGAIDDVENDDLKSYLGTGKTVDSTTQQGWFIVK